VKLTELNLVGFKSFAKKTNILFNDGMTAIVGPNGCGKSNIVDAIRWVMGEQRTSALRSEKMDNVIFNGSGGAKAVGMAEVSLRIENTRNLLPVDYAEVLVTRRLFRSGESHYLINGNQVRLKDIMDLFMDTGLTGQSYSVIELPQVEKLLNGLPEERRRIFEEAAGITKFKQRRKLTFRKLEATEKDLVRVEDIMSEVDKTVRGLKRQVSKAERYQELAAELKRIEIRLAAFDYSHMADELEPLETTLHLSQNDREASAADLAGYDAAYEALRSQLLDLEKQLTDVQTRYNQSSREVQKFEERLLVNSERIRSLKESQERYQKERILLIDRQKELEQSADELNYESREAKQNLETARAEYTALNAEYQSIRSQVEAKRMEIKKAEAEVLLLTEEFSKKQNEGERLKATEEGLSQRVFQLEEDIKRFKQRSSELADELLRMRGQESDHLAKLEIEQQKLGQAINLAEESRSVLDRLNKLEMQDRNRIELLENNAEMVRKVMESYQDFPAGVRFLATFKSEHFVSEGAVANVVNVQQEHRTAISSALGEAATYLIVKDASAAYSGIGLLQQDRKGIVSFIPLEQLRPPVFAHPAVDDLGVIGWANQIVRCQERYKEVIDGLLGDYLVVQDMETANRLFDSLKQHRINMVTLAGEVLGYWGIIRGGIYNKRQSDIVGRQEELERFQVEIETLVQGSERRQIQITGKSAEEKQYREQVVEYTTTVKSIEQALGDVRLELGQREFEEVQLRDSLNQAVDEKNNLLSRVVELGQNLQLQNTDSATLQQRRAQLTQNSQLLENELRTLEGEQTLVGDRVQKLQVNVAKFQSEFEALQRQSDSLRQQITETKRMIDLRDQENVRAAQEIDELTEVNEEYRERSTELHLQLDSLQKSIDQLREAQYETNVQADEKEKIIRAMRNKNQTLSDSVHQIELRVSELKMRMQTLAARIVEEYEYQLKRAPEEEGLDVESSRTLVSDLKERLKSIGPVNLLALKEYEQEKERLDFLESQRADLIKARNNLTETIDIINKTAREKFLETFERVQKNFTTVFRTFFEGGRASLVLREGNDPLEADIDIYAAPGGKKPASLQLLSGGEKSLTAVSLLFAIYLVKPSPFCIFDEVDAPLDDKNVQRFASALREFAKNTQFIVVTHNKLTMHAADQLYGVTMEEEGISKVVSVKFEAAEAYAV